MLDDKTMIPGYAVFSDESRHTAARYRTIAAVSMPAESVVDRSDELRTVLKNSGVREFKWKKLRSAKDRFCAMKLIDLILREVRVGRTRVDVLTWDTCDRRHAVPGRDDRQNFERMFFHLHHGLMRRREAEAEWHVRADERLDIDWNTIRDCLCSVGARRKLFEQPLFGEAYSAASFRIGSFKQVVSSGTPMTQVADLFAGVAAYARDRAQMVSLCLEEQSGQRSLMPDAAPPALSSGDTERLHVVNHLYERCRQGRLGVSLRTDGYFRTPDPKRPINFWHYEPQHANDRAPTRS